MVLGWWQSPSNVTKGLQDFSVLRISWQYINAVEIISPLYRWCVCGWSYFPARHDRARAIELDEFVAELREIYLESSHHTRWGLLIWLNENPI